ncbi:hypothetical protein ColTof4_11543 [Colletotrichum tofieldiae]|nr:hypothetical protein ColTof3_03387 [Colletotrichum tofieldiae]GKT79120.1 hypothetical protein ColTof4_11543 [Colletotrichum tofieldiae]GKT82278.1 hypothetical protein Ct61P_00128 [Colletotrichum tofieldiae]
MEAAGLGLSIVKSDSPKSAAQVFGHASGGIYRWEGRDNNMSSLILGSDDEGGNSAHEAEILMERGFSRIDLVNVDADDPQDFDGTEN